MNRHALLRESLPENGIVPGGAQLASWPTLLIVDDDLAMLQTLVCYFEKRGFHVAAAKTLAEAKNYFHRRKVWTLVLSDYHLPDGTGAELEYWVREHSAATPVLLMTGSPQGAALCAGTDFLPKPFPPETLERRLRQLLGR